MPHLTRLTPVHHVFGALSARILLSTKNCEMFIFCNIIVKFEMGLQAVVSIVFTVHTAKPRPFWRQNIVERF